MTYRALFFMFGWVWCGFHKKHAGIHYAELVFLHPVGSVGHAVHSGYRFQKSNETHYTELMFLHPVGSAGSHSAFLVHLGTKRQRTIFHARVGLVQIP
jgi:hypothetical protein